MAATRSKGIKISILQTKDESTLIEYQDAAGYPCRAYLPTLEVEGKDKISKATLDLAIPFGIPWAAMLDLSDLTPERIEQELHKFGIWTRADLDHKDRLLIRLATNMITQAVRSAAEKG